MTVTQQDRELAVRHLLHELVEGRLRVTDVDERLLRLHEVRTVDELRRIVPAGPSPGPGPGQGPGPGSGRVMAAHAWLCALLSALLLLCWAVRPGLVGDPFLLILLQGAAVATHVALRLRRSAPFTKGTDDE